MMVPVLICRCGPTGSAISETRRVVAGVSLDLLDSGLIELLRLQREIPAEPQRVSGNA